MAVSRVWVRGWWKWKKEEGAGLAGQGAILFLLGPLTQLSSFTLVCDSPSSQVPSIAPNPSKGRKRMIKICIIYTALQLCFLGQATARVVVALINLLTGSLCSSFKVISIFSTRCVGEKPSKSTTHRTHRIRSPQTEKGTIAQKYATHFAIIAGCLWG